jgi:hypothetical protein
MLRIARFLENAAVERQPAQFPIEVAGLGLRFRNRGRSDLAGIVHQLLRTGSDTVDLAHCMS